MLIQRKTARHAIALLLAIALPLSAQSFDLSWHSIDGGGGLASTGGGFDLSGFIGQPDAGAMTGGNFALSGGFLVAAFGCTCPSDVNGDGVRNGIDVEGFVACFVATGVNCACADVNNIPGLDPGDVAVFVADLLAGTACP